MDSAQDQEYRGLVRGAAAYVLAEEDDPPVDALELARLYHLDFAKVCADVNAAVQIERRKRDKFFVVETMVP